MQFAWPVFWRWCDPQFAHKTPKELFPQRNCGQVPAESRERNRNNGFAAEERLPASLRQDCGTTPINKNFECGR
jgi:hypothetical protein